MDGYPIDGEALLIAAAKASVPPRRLPELVDLVQADLRLRLDDYRTNYESVVECEDYVVFLVESGHWEGIGKRLDVTRQAYDAVQRAHTEQLHRIGYDTDRSDEFDTALEIRECVFIGKEEACEGARPAHRTDR
ncbi:hypothetical protein [Haloarchaeobius sp. DFWS5]|uniref:hypothetical protein n=1 Tax=Haloarchaeobius sp. DFWS5 TaxID=3446114 RepID=UPI003EBEA5EB